MEEYHYNNWDLAAVVRLACRRFSPPPDPFSALPPPPPAVKEEEGKTEASWRFLDLSSGGGGLDGTGQDADELLKAFLAASPAPPPALPLPPQEQKQPDMKLQAAAPAAKGQPGGRQVSGAVQRSKRRKNQQKKVVCHVPADGAATDVWAWRKYGQKPIKGSPYPRGYYRCSSSKGCMARKQVERSRSDPSTFIITYTGEHSHPAPTHRNSLAGTTRHKLPSSAAASASTPPPAPSASAGLSPTTPLRSPSMEEEEEEEEDDAGELLVEDMEMAGEDELVFLNPADATALDAAAAPPALTSLFDADVASDDPFLCPPWVGVAATTGGSETAAGS